MVEIYQPHDEGVASLNGLTGDVTLVAGTNITLVPIGNDITINSTGGAGVTGYTGYTGNNGSSGVTGYTGYTGSGSTGYTGYTGSGGATGYTGNGYWTQSGTTLYYNTGNVSIGTSAPASLGQQLQITGPNAGFYFKNTTSAARSVLFASYKDSNVDVPFYIDEYTSADAFSSNRFRIYSNASGLYAGNVNMGPKVLINGASNSGASASTLDVVGNVSIGSYAGNNAAPSNGLIVSGNVGIGTTTPTAYLNIKAGTATAGTAPFKLTSGVLNTTPEAGAIEYLSGVYYATNAVPTRNIIAMTPVANPGLGTVATPLVIVTAQLTALGAQGSMTFINGILVASTPAT